MSTSRAPGRRSACTAAAALLTTGALLILLNAVTGHRPPPAAPDTARAGLTDNRQTPASVPRAPAMTRSEPIRITIPEIGLDTRIEGVTRAGDGTLAMPADPDHAGWYTHSVTPGENGNTILVGHLDSPTGPAAFYGLSALRNGDTIRLTRQDKAHATYTVRSMTLWPTPDLPAKDVYAPTLHPRLTLITCADWDPRARTYRSNLVITAHR